MEKDVGIMRGGLTRTAVDAFFSSPVEQQLRSNLGQKVRVPVAIHILFNFEDAPSCLAPEIPHDIVWTLVS